MSEQYTYDAVGNRLSSLGMAPYSYNSSNHLTSTPAAIFTYDNNGNTASKVDGNGTTTYAWDRRDRLTSVTLPNNGGTVSFAYDPFGRRVRRITPSGTTIYIYDGASIIAELDASGNVVARYTQGTGIDEPLAMLRGGAVSFYHADGLGSITALTDGTGATAATYTYDAFGQPVASSGSIVSPFRYTGREWDEELHLSYHRARYYSLATGRFLSEDPIRFGGGINWYSYVHNSPSTLVDPSGLAAFGIGLNLAGALATPQIAGFVEGGCSGVVDTKGNLGVLCCGGIGFGVGVGASLTVQLETIVCPNCATICDLEGLYVKFTAFGGKGGTVSGSGGLSVSESVAVFHGAVGAGVGAGGGGGVVLGRCRLVAGGSQCKECKPTTSEGE